MTPADGGADRIELRGLRVRGHHGVLEHERRDGQDFVADLVLWTDHITAAHTDALADTVDYGVLAEDVARVLEGPPRDLVETVAVEIADTVLADDRVRRVEVTLHKPSAPLARAVDDVAVVVSRSRDHRDHG